jgi:hypothetical protein
LIKGVVWNNTLAGIGRDYSGDIKKEFQNMGLNGISEYKRNSKKYKKII